MLNLLSDKKLVEKRLRKVRETMSVYIPTRKRRSKTSFPMNMEDTFYKNLNGNRKPIMIFHKHHLFVF